MTDTTGNDSDTTEVRSKPAKEVLVVKDQGFFQHDTGDYYDGFFEAKKKDKSVKMNGPGTYTTAEGDTYTGTWENDRLATGEEVTITFHDGSKYEGFFRDWSYNGLGRYQYPDGAVLIGVFVDNCPITFLTMADPNGHTWLAKAEQGFAWFEPMNHFYEMLDKTLPGGKVKRRRHRQSKPEVSGPQASAGDQRVKPAKSKLKQK